MTDRFSVRDVVYHIHDPLCRPCEVLETFMWLGQRKLIARRQSDGERVKDWEYEFKHVQTDSGTSEKA